MGFKELKQTCKKLQDDLDLTKRFPNYFHRWVFNIAFITIIIMFILVAYEENFDFSKHAYIECNSEFPCTNPFYFCHNEIKNNTGRPVFFNGMLVDCEQYNSFGCVDGICQDEFIQPHKSLGVKPSDDYNKFTLASFVIILLALSLNHILYILGWKKCFR